MTRAERSRARGVLRISVVALAAVVALVIVSAGGLLVLRDPPVAPFEPVRWSPRPGLTVRGDTVEVAPPGRIESLPGEIDGPEDIVVDKAGRIYTSAADGRILRTTPGRRGFDVFARVGGRPLGMALDADGRLIVANHGIGLQAVAPSGDVTLLTDSAGGEPIRFANDIVIAEDGAVYLSDSNARFNNTSLPGLPSHSLYDFLEGRPRGRLLRYDPATRATTVLLSGLYFPNGIVITADQQSLLVAESTRYRIIRYRIAGARAGTAELFLDHLPGIADGFTSDRQGRLLLAMYDRAPVLDRLVLPSTLARQLLARVPSSVLVSGDPRPGSILVLSERGEVLRHLTGIRPAPANVVPDGDRWVLGALTGTRVRTMPALAAIRLTSAPHLPSS